MLLYLGMEKNAESRLAQPQVANQTSLDVTIQNSIKMRYAKLKLNLSAKVHGVPTMISVGLKVLQLVIISRCVDLDPNEELCQALNTLEQGLHEILNLL